jgi:hypothetical protein
MNKEQSLALYAKGKDAWNAWANEMLDKRKAMETAGSWSEDKDDEGEVIHDQTREWLEAANLTLELLLFADFLARARCLPGLYIE